MNGAYYNEIDPKAAATLRELIKRGVIAPGDVDERSIEDVRPTELAQYVQCHFFAGGGIWSYALRQAGWPDDRPVWTGSCPCQPFSGAGEGVGFADPRHLWPAWFWLIRQRRPGTIFGEQVASGDGIIWLDLVRSDLEGAKYRVGPLDLPAAGFGAPHRRQRIFFVADADGWDSGAKRIQRGREHGLEPNDGGFGILANTHGPERGHGREVGRAPGSGESEGPKRERVRAEPGHGGDVGPVDNPIGPGLEGFAGNGISGRGARGSEVGAPGPASATGATGELADAKGIAGGVQLHPREPRRSDAESRGPGEAGDVADSPGIGRGPGSGREPGSEDEEWDSEAERGEVLAESSGLRSDGGAGPTNGFWRSADWIFCRDRQWRPVEPGTFPLAHGAAERMGRLRVYGNAIVAPVAEAFIKAYMSEIDEQAS